MPKYNVEMIYEFIEFFEVEADNVEEAMNLVTSGEVMSEDSETSYIEHFIEEIKYY